MNTQSKIDKINREADKAIATMFTLPAQRYSPTSVLPTKRYNVEANLSAHRRANLKAHRPMFRRVGGLHWVRLGRLTLQWSWRR